MAMTSEEFKKASLELAKKTLNKDVQTVLNFAKEYDLTLAGICAEAYIDPSTFWRISNGASIPTYTTMAQLKLAVKLLKEKIDKENACKDATTV